MSESTFDEAEYLSINLDVAAAVESGKFSSGREHYELFGKKEGRMLKRSLGRISREDKVTGSSG